MQRIIIQIYMDILIFVNIFMVLVYILSLYLYKEVPQPYDCGTKGNIMISISAVFTAETRG